MTGPPADTPGGAEAALLRGTSEARKMSAFELKGPGKGGWRVEVRLKVI